MRIDYIKPFAEASSDILYKYIGDEIKIEGISLLNYAPTISGVMLVVSLSGYAEGHFMLYMSNFTSEKIIELMSGVKFDSFDKLSVSTIQELINLIAGMSVTKLALKGYDINIATPVIISGNDVRILTMRSEALEIKINTAIGYFNILVSVESEKE